MTRAALTLSVSAAGRPFAAFRHRLAAFWQALARRAESAYRPERHYMRGPGPAWRAKNDVKNGPLPAA